MDRVLMLELADGSRFPARVNREVEVKRVRSDRAVLPDPRWTLTDPSGHPHRWDLSDKNEPKLPTLRREDRHVECDGSCGSQWDCDGYDIDVYFCRECGAEIEPQYIPDTYARDVGWAVSETVQYEVTFQADRWVFGGVNADGVIRVTSDRGLHGAHLVSAGERIQLPPMYWTATEVTSGDDVQRFTIVGSEYRAVPRERARA